MTKKFKLTYRLDGEKEEENMIIEKAMQGNTLEIKLSITKDYGLYNVSLNDDESGLAMISAAEVDTLTVAEILRCLYDKTYGVENPRFETDGT